MIQEILLHLSKQRFVLDNEKHLQEQMYARLLSHFGPIHIDVKREVALDDQRKDIIDFMVLNTGIEVKLRYNKRQMFRQVERYCNSGKLTNLILYTSSPIGMPPSINGVDIYVLSPSHSWL